MDAAVTSLKCHTCAAPQTVEGVRFTCGYCGTTNIITAVLQSFFLRASHQSANPDSYSAVTNLVHTLTRIRSYTSNQISAISADLASLLEDEERIAELLADDQNELKDAQAGFEVARLSFWSSVWVCVFAIPVIWFVAFPSQRNPDGFSSLVYAAGVLVFANFCRRPSHGILCAVILGLSLALDDDATRVGAILVVALVFISAVKANGAVKEASWRVAELHESQEDRKTLQEKHDSRVSSLVTKHARMLSEVRSFLDARNEFNTVKDGIPIGIQTDDALSTLNDLSFGNIIGTLENCSRYVAAWEKRSDVVRQLLRDASDLWQQQK